MTKSEFILASKRKFQGGKPKSGGKTVREEPEENDDAESGEAEDGEDSLDDSVSKNRGGSKKKKVHKMPARKS